MNDLNFDAGALLFQASGYELVGKPDAPAEPAAALGQPARWIVRLSFGLGREDIIQ